MWWSSAGAGGRRRLLWPLDGESATQIRNQGYAQVFDCPASHRQQSMASHRRQSMSSEWNSRATAAPWADLLPEMCNLVRERLDPISIIRFPAVCRDWSTACEVYPLLRPGLPALLTPSVDSDGYDTERSVEAGAFCLHDVSACGGGGRKSFLGEAEGFKDRAWVGGNHGWLVTTDIRCEDVQLLNPVTGARVYLPSLYTISEVKRLAHFSVGDHKYNEILKNTAADDVSYMDAIVLDGKLFAVDKVGRIYSWHLDGGAATTEPTVVQGPNIDDMSRQHDYDRCAFYLAASGDDGHQQLLLIYIYGYEIEDVYKYHRTYPWDERVLHRMVFDKRRSFGDRGMSVHELDASSGTWRRVTDFGGDRALFLGANYPFFVTVRHETGLEADCVYLADTPSGYDVAIFDLKEGHGSDGHIKQQLHYSLVNEPFQMPMWFLPTEYPH
ncbi:hypothetical protein Zm00014a_023136 [Zea mays]|uniref:KIB1-4 beta-propeller domain-containing protein n=1 Tax=Zea mays TaxID=4577 RepID=A0A3L6FTL6_MAIZE|nr:hypothetical protein Zm00014a_023136 [Zea mays]